MANKHGSLSIDSENLFPIIKKWLYSDHDIFYRELISNGCDAITKLKKLEKKVKKLGKMLVGVILIQLVLIDIILNLHQGNLLTYFSMTVQFQNL